MQREIKTVIITCDKCNAEISEDCLDKITVWQNDTWGFAHLKREVVVHDDEMGQLDFCNKECATDYFRNLIEEL